MRLFGIEFCFSLQPSRSGLSRLLYEDLRHSLAFFFSLSLSVSAGWFWLINVPVFPSLSLFYYPGTHLHNRPHRHAPSKQSCNNGDGLHFSSRNQLRLHPSGQFQHFVFTSLETDEGPCGLWVKGVLCKRVSDSGVGNVICIWEIFSAVE